MEIERHEPVTPEPTFTLELTQRELDLIFIATDRAGSGNVGDEKPKPLSGELQGEMDMIYADLIADVEGRDEAEARLGIDFDG